MSQTKQARDTIYLDPAKLDLLKVLASETRIARAELLREAVDDLLVKYRKIKPRQGRRGR